MPDHVGFRLRVEVTAVGVGYNQVLMLSRANHESLKAQYPSVVNRMCVPFAHSRARVRAGSD